MIMLRSLHNILCHSLEYFFVENEQNIPENTDHEIPYILICALNGIDLQG